MTKLFALVILMPIFAATDSCGGGSVPVDSGPVGPDAGIVPDAGVDAAPDATSDAPPDAAL